MGVGTGGRGGKTRESGDWPGEGEGRRPAVAVCESGILLSRGPGARGEWAMGFAGFDPPESDLDCASWELSRPLTETPRVICAAGLPQVDDAASWDRVIAIAVRPSRPSHGLSGGAVPRSASRSRLSHEIDWDTALGLFSW
jgi:hypothetical protein